MDGYSDREFFYFRFQRRAQVEVAARGGCFGFRVGDGLAHRPAGQVRSGDRDDLAGAVEVEAEHFGFALQHAEGRVDHGGDADGGAAVGRADGPVDGRFAVRLGGEKQRRGFVFGVRAGGFDRDVDGVAAAVGLGEQQGGGEGQRKKEGEEGELHVDGGKGFKISKVYCSSRRAWLIMRNSSRTRAWLGKALVMRPAWLASTGSSTTEPAGPPLRRSAKNAAVPASCRVAGACSKGSGVQWISGQDSSTIWSLATSRKRTETLPTGPEPSGSTWTSYTATPDSSAAISAASTASLRKSSFFRRCFS